MKRILPFAAIVATLLLARPALAEEAEKPICGSYAECNARGTKAYQAKQYAEAIHFFEEQLINAETADDVKEQLVAINNLALARLKKGEPLYAKAWLSVAISLKGDDKATLFNQGEVDKAIAALPARPPIGGTYYSYGGASQWQSIELAAKNKTTFTFTMLALRLGNNWREWGPAGIGELEGEIVVKGNQADYKEKVDYAEEACQFHFDFDGDEMEVDQLAPDFNCGFGNAVSAAGHYYRIKAP